MCGIAGIFGSLPKDKKIALIKGMTSTLQHRGPDEWGLYYSEDLALGHTRLAIIDIKQGHQPMGTDRYIIIYNGELYNFQELKEDLLNKGIPFKTNSDTEVVLKSFELYSTECFKKFNGQFALLIWDKIDKKLYIARDRFGIRPLYILKFQNLFYFSSEIKAFDIIPNFNRSFNIENLFEHALLWNTLADNTVFKNIRSLPAGTFEIYQQNSDPKNIRYYEIGEKKSNSPKNFKEAKEIFFQLLDEAVTLRLKSDVPVGTYLSGGIDSSVISYLTKQKMDSLKTFSVSFSDQQYDESTFQIEMAQLLNSQHQTVKINNESIEKNFFEAAYFFERPVFRTAPVPLFLLSKLVQKSDIKVILTGEAADEILFGYDSYKEIQLLNKWKTNPESKEHLTIIKNLYPHLSHYKDPKMFGLIKMYYQNFLKDFDNNLLSLNIRASNNKILEKFFNPDYNIKFDQGRLLNNISEILPDNFSEWSLLQKNQFLEMKTLLPGYLLSSQADRMSLAHNIEGRYPFLDHLLVDSLFYFDDSYKLKGLKQKHLLSETFKNYIPKSIIERPKRPYIAPDLRAFISPGNFSELINTFLSKKAIEDYGIFNFPLVDRFLNKFKNHIPDEIGYRDNMIIIFLLSTQIISHWIKNPLKYELKKSTQKIIIDDYY